LKSLWLKIFFFTKAFSDISAMLGKISIDIALALVARIADLAVKKSNFSLEGNSTSDF